MDLLVAKPVLVAAIRALPGYAVAGHPPKIFLHALLAYIKPAPADPAKREFSAAAMTDAGALAPLSLSITAFQ
jgi:hypothetical protein